MTEAMKTMNCHCKPESRQSLALVTMSLMRTWRTTILTPVLTRVTRAPAQSNPSRVDGAASPLPATRNQRRRRRSEAANRKPKLRNRKSRKGTRGSRNPKRSPNGRPSVS
uniref:Uncharacterized protein n=1 Tax=Cacopsylla melanoneura TaxID=428564 RepID=A0A8D9BWL8_9HEMI